MAKRCVGATIAPASDDAITTARGAPASTSTRLASGITARYHQASPSARTSRA
jgi:hypothetical protein